MITAMLVIKSISNFIIKPCHPHQPQPLHIVWTTLPTPKNEKFPSFGFSSPSCQPLCEMLWSEWDCGCSGTGILAGPRLAELVPALRVNKELLEG